MFPSLYRFLREILSPSGDSFRVPRSDKVRVYVQLHEEGLVASFFHYGSVSDCIDTLPSVYFSILRNFFFRFG